MTRTVRRDKALPRITLIALLVVYGLVAHWNISSMAGLDKLYPSAVFLTAIAVWGIARQSGMFSRSTPSGAWATVKHYGRKLKHRRVFWPGLVLLSVLGCCCSPGHLMIG